MRTVLFLLLASCASPAPRSAGSATDPDSAGGAATDTGDGPAPHADPLVRGPTLDLASAGPELTDAVLVDDLLLFAGQEQRGDGGIWAFDVSDPDSPVLTGRTAIWHLQRVCWSGAEAFGLTREGVLQRVAIEEQVPVPTDRYPLSAWAGGLDCVGNRVAVALLQAGVRVFEVTGPAPEGLTTVASLEQAATDVLWENDRLWVLAEQELSAWTLAEGALTRTGAVSLSGTCRDLSPGSDWIAVACGAGGVAVVDRGEGVPALLSQWSGGLSVRSVAVQQDHILVAAWTDLALLDASSPDAPRLRGTEPAGSAVMSVAAGPGQQAWVADWSAPFGLTWDRVDAPEVRATARVARPGDTVTVVNDGLADLVVEAKQGQLDAALVAPGGFALWTLPEEEGAEPALITNDPDEPDLVVSVAVGDGLQPGAVAPRFIETDLDGQTWDLDALSGKVVFVGMFQDGCPTCESEVPDTDAWLLELAAEEPNLVALWSFGGPQARGREWRQEAGIDLPILADEDDSMRRDYFIPNGEDAFAANPRHYVIGRDGRLVAVLTAPSPSALRAALTTALAE